MKPQTLIEYLSPSSMMAYLSNPMYFKKRYILKQYDNEKSVTALIGIAGHKALERLYSGMSVDDAILEGQRVIESTSDFEIKYNTTVSSREKLIVGYNRAINFYIAEQPLFHKIISIEENINTDADSIVSPGAKLPLPINVRLDMLTANEQKEIEIIDHKFVYNYTNPDVDDFKRWLQGMFYYYAVWSKYGVAPKRMKFLECKTSQNKDGSSQIKPWVMEYDKEEDFVIFERLFGDVILDMNNPGKLFLPNPGDMMNGQDMFEIYRHGDEIMGVAAPISVKHRTEEMNFVDRQFVPSAGSSASTETYTPEERIRKKLQEFGIVVDMQTTYQGPSVAKYTMLPSRGVRMSKVLSHDRDLALVLEAETVSIEAPIPGTNLVGVEVPSKERRTVPLTDEHLMPGTLNIPVGMDVYGKVTHADIADMPHLLIAGSTGSGKSVMLNVILHSLTNQMTPDKLKMVLIDPKQVELTAYEKSPHLLMPVVTDTVQATVTLDRMVSEMEKRYTKLREAGVKKIGEYKCKDMPYIIVVIDEFADLMMMADNKAQNFSLNAASLVNEIVQFSQRVYDINSIVTEKGVHLSQQKRQEDREAKKQLKELILSAAFSDVPPAEHSIIRLAQKARAVGIHLILATQRPSADVVTGLIKANIPTKIAFATTTAINSKIILDQAGAEQLTGKGDMLFSPPSGEIKRLQGLYI